MSTAFSRKLKATAQRIERNLIVLYLARRDPRVSLLAKVFIIIVVGYAISPIDLIPDFIPVLGYLDDLVFLPLGIYLCFLLMPDHIVRELREKAQTLIELEKSFIAGTIIVGIWLAIIFVIGAYIVRYSGS